MPKDEEIVLPETESDKESDYSYNDIHGLDARDIAEGKEAPKPPEKEEKEEVELEEVDLQKIQEEAAQKAVKQIEEKQRAEAEQRAIEEQRRKEAEEKEQQEQERLRNELKDEKLQKMVDDFKAKNGRDPSWQELGIEIREQERQRLLEEQQQRQKEQEDKIELEKKQQEEAQNRANKERETLNKFIDDELDDLYAQNKLTKIADPKNASDPGVIERKEFFRQWGEVNAKRRQEGKPEILSASRIFYNYYKAPRTTPAGENAPVAGNRGSSEVPQSDDSPGYTNADLKKPWGWFRKG